MTGRVFVPGAESHTPSILVPLESRPKLSSDLLMGRIIGVFYLHTEGRGFLSIFALEPREVFE